MQEVILARSPSRQLTRTAVRPSCRRADRQPSRPRWTSRGHAEARGPRPRIAPPVQSRVEGSFNLATETQSRTGGPSRWPRSRVEGPSIWPTETQSRTEGPSRWPRSHRAGQRAPAIWPRRHSAGQRAPVIWPRSHRAEPRAPSSWPRSLTDSASQPFDRRAIVPIVGHPGPGATSRGHARGAGPPAANSPTRPRRQQHASRERRLRGGRGGPVRGPPRTRVTNFRRVQRARLAGSSSVVVPTAAILVPVRRRGVTPEARGPRPRTAPPVLGARSTRHGRGACAAGGAAPRARA